MPRWKDWVPVLAGRSTFVAFSSSGRMSADLAHSVAISKGTRTLDKTVGSPLAGSLSETALPSRRSKRKRRRRPYRWADGDHFFFVPGGASCSIAGWATPPGGRPLESNPNQHISLIRLGCDSSISASGESLIGPPCIPNFGRKPNAEKSQGDPGARSQTPGTWVVRRRSGQGNCGQVAVDAPAIDEWRNAFGPYRELEQNRERPVIHG
jgi:hypothetical protein